MAKRKKHQFHCEACNAPCEIYRKGKGHRVLICPNCGVLATNPGFWRTLLTKPGPVAKDVGRQLGVIAQSTADEWTGGGVSKALGEGGAARSSTVPPQKKARFPYSAYYVDKALGGR